MNRNTSPLILTPGPVKVPDFVIEAIGQVVIHQRSAAFETFFADLQTDLRYLFQTQHPVIAMAGTGTFGMESVIYSLFKPGDRVVVTDFGKFSNRWVRFSRQLGLRVTEVVKEWGECPATDEVLDALESHDHIKGVILTHCETSTGVAIDLEEMALAIKQRFPNVLVAVDAMSTVGCAPFYMDEWKVDAAVTASQKALLNPAGTVFAAIGPQAAEAITPVDDDDCFYLYPYYEAVLRNRFPFTPPTQLLSGIRASLRHIRGQGLPQYWNHTHQMSRRFKAGVVALGAELRPVQSCDSLTVFSFPNLNHKRIASRLFGEHLIEVASGQGEWKNEVLRVAHFGALTMADVESCLQALEKIVHAEQVPVP